jgi:pSer/pThr/pTyr-binding forkhead associated (FHA) protein
MPYLMLLNEKNLPACEWELGDEPLTVGRGEDADVQIADAQLSRSHFRIRCEEGKYIVADLDSSSGTMLNDERVASAALKPGDMIRAGASRFYYDVGVDTFIQTQVSTAADGDERAVDVHLCEPEDREGGNRG